MIARGEGFADGEIVRLPGADAAVKIIRANDTARTAYAVQAVLRHADPDHAGGAAGSGWEIPRRSELPAALCGHPDPEGDVMVAPRRKRQRRGKQAEAEARTRATRRHSGKKRQKRFRDPDAEPQTTEF